MLHDIDGVERLKFVTNFPKDMGKDLLGAARDLPKCSNYLHVPLQSGSNRILKGMKRGYTVEEYREMMARIREILPEAAVSSDFIVGFSGETEEDFQRSVAMVRECRFKNSFIFKYSERPGTKAAELFSDDVPYEIKRRRNNELLALQDQISEQDNRRFLGRTVEVLVEGPSKMAEKRGEQSEVLQLTGRSTCDRIVVFEGTKRLVGQILPIAIDDCTAHTLFGHVATEHRGPALFTIETPTTLLADG
jgi:tRNA-2-methylthio-N6-dimethylallyladenosine synthase